MGRLHQDIRFAARQLVAATDALTFAGGAAVLCAVAGIASYFPARRGASVDPTVTLRSE